MKTSIFLMVFVSLLCSASYNTYAQCHLRLVGDVNGDTLADIVGFGANQVSVALGQRDGRFAAPIDVFSNFSNADGWRVGEHLRYLADVNGDRRVDIVGFGANQVSVALGRADGRFDAPISPFNRFTNADGWRVSEHLRYLADVNGDRRADIVGFGENQVSVALGRTDGRFDPPIDVFNHFTIAQGWRIGEHLRELADVNGDGRADIVGFGADRVWVALGQRDGRFAPSAEVFNRFSNADGWQVGRHLRLLADVNGDTLADIVGFGANRVSVALGQRDGRFATPIDVFNHFTNAEGWNVGEYPRHLADVNGDNRADIVGFGANRISVAIGRRDGRFDAPIDVFSNFSNADGWRVGEHLRFVIDLNNDRMADIIGFGTERVAIALGQADGRFGAPNGVLNHFTSVNGGWATCREQQDQNIARIIATPSVVITPPSTGLRGWVDMHTHPMARWGFGEELFWGENDGDPSRALGPCKCFHRGWDLFENTCGNSFREAVVNETDISGHDTGGGCFPSFTAWPKHNAVLHQQMWVDWIHRAYEGGLRVMVALAVNNHCLADASETKGPNDDMRSMNIQIQKMIEFVERDERNLRFMEIAFSPADVRRIVNANKLAIILGIEMDNIGNFYNPADGKGGTYITTPSTAQVRSEIDRLYNLGVRYIFPIHVTNNIFGGSAIYEHGFNVANKYNNGSAFSVEPVDSRNGITFKLQNPYTALDELGVFAMNFMGTVIPGHIMPNNRANYPEYSDPGLSRGHRNILGLTDMGRFAVRYMMQKGMLIDIDHCSEKAVDEILNIARSNDYPVNSGHNGPRGSNGTENGRTDTQYTTIQSLGGIIGLGHGENANNFLSGYRRVLALTGNKQVCIGTDVNGFYPLPSPPPVNARITYGGSTITQCVMGSKTWDFNTEGVAHYGLMPDYIKSWEAAGMTTNEKEIFFKSAEYFAQMWEKCERQKSAVR